MNSELKQLVISLTVALPVGGLLGFLVLKKRPEWCKRYTKVCVNVKWWLFLLGLLFFAGLAAKSFIENRPYYGSIFVVFALWQAVCIGICVLRRKEG